MSYNPEFEIDLHRGETLLRLANTYPSLLLTLIEGAQNGIDAEADRIMLCIDLSKRLVTMADNGNGTTTSQFAEALMSVGKGIKSKDKLGRFGLGLISPLTKCNKFTFTSTSLGSRSTNCWTFEQRKIKHQHHKLTIPHREIDGKPRLRQQFEAHAEDEFRCNYNTIVTMEGVVQDRTITGLNLDDLESQIHSKLGSAMRTRKVQIRVVLIDERGRLETRDITSTTYNGEPLGVVAYETTDTGRVEFELYRATKLGGRRQGRVSVMAGGDNYPITMVEFVRQARGRVGDMIGDALKVLNSGYFEGIIRCENIELHAERTKFEYNDALEMLYLVIDQWYDEIGKEHYQLEQEQTREARYAEIGLKTANRLHELLGKPEYARLWDGLMSITTHGLLGAGHVDPERGRVLNGFDDETTTRVGQGGAGQKRTPRPEGSAAPSGRSGEREPKDRPGDKPVGIRGTGGGTKRQLVRGDSKGLWFGFESMPGNTQLWEFDRTVGAVTVNTRHFVWVSLDETKGRHTAKNAKQIQHLLEWLALEVLNLLLVYPDETDFENHRSLIDSKVRLYVDMFITSPSR